MNLVDFLDARIAEDERVARDAIESNDRARAILRAGPVGATGDHHLLVDDDRDSVEISTVRILAECKAKRAIIAERTPTDHSAKTDDELHALFAHPDYDYLTVETGRKSGENDDPPDSSWEPNPIIYRGADLPPRNWRRFDYTERRRTTPRPAPSPPLALRILAAVYASHPDYDPAWRLTDSGSVT